MTHFQSLIAATFLMMTASAPVTVWAGEVDVEKVEAERSADGTWRFSVTLRHGDEGWDHYANAWEVVAPDGSVLGRRVLLHPHVDEQPFTRSLSGVAVPSGVTTVTVRGVDSVHETGGKQMTVELSGQ